MAVAAKVALVYGGAGQLGAQLTGAFGDAGWTTVSADLRKSDKATHSIIIHGDPAKDAHTVVEFLRVHHLSLDVLVCAAGGWAGGNAAADDFFTGLDKMWRFNVQSAAASVHVACHALKAGGLAVLLGAAAALKPTPGMLAYGASKAATHHLVQSVAATGGGLPAGASLSALCPITLDTPTNRADMPTADFSSWTPLSEVAAIVLRWAADPAQRPASGSLHRLVTVKGVTSTELIQ